MLINRKILKINKKLIIYTKCLIQSNKNNRISLKQQLHQKREKFLIKMINKFKKANQSKVEVIIKKNKIFMKMFIKTLIFFNEKFANL